MLPNTHRIKQDKRKVYLEQTKRHPKYGFNQPNYKIKYEVDLNLINQLILQCKTLKDLMTPP